MKNLGKLMAVLLLIVLSPLIQGFVFMKLWNWFAVPIFELNTLNLIEAIGLAYLIGYVRYKADDSPQEKGLPGEIFIKAILHLIIPSVIFLFLGWIVQSFM